MVPFIHLFDANVSAYGLNQFRNVAGLVRTWQVRDEIRSADIHPVVLVMFSQSHLKCAKHPFSVVLDMFCCRC